MRHPQAPDANLIEAAFTLYKKSGKVNAPKGKNSTEFRCQHSHPSREVKFVGVWDTVGALGIPISFLGFFDEKDEFYDTKLGRNVRIARHALAIDEIRVDFEPSIWKTRENLDLKQVWFSGAHADIGGSQKPDKDGSLVADIALDWMLREVNAHGLTTERHLNRDLTKNPTAKIHPSRRKFYRLKKKHYRPIDHKHSELLIHKSVKIRWEQDKDYRPKNLKTLIEKQGWPDKLER